tara:strand:+ start:503 stop:940 length:438 start_codon:yes stop_codon:yes gene_type:complete
MKLFFILFFSLILSIFPSNAEKYHDEINWIGKCFIQFKGKIVIENEICEMSSNQMPRDNYDDFTITVLKKIDCDDGKKGCAHFFYAYQEKLLKRYIYHIAYYEWDKSSNVRQIIRPTDIDFYIEGKNKGICFLKDNNKFCFEFNK